MSDEAQQPAGDPEPPKPGLLQVVHSVMMAFLGVQSSDKRQRDFQQGNFWVFVVVGLIFTVLFVLTVVLVVNTVLSGA